MGEVVNDSMRESEVFAGPKRYQRPISWHTDTYSAVLLKDLSSMTTICPEKFQKNCRVAVKGPFKSKRDAEVARTVQKFKRVATRGFALPLLEFLVIELVPDLFPESKNRQKWRKQWNEFWFLVTEDITNPLELPLVKAEPSANWPEGIELVDWDALKEKGYYNAIPTRSTYEESIFKKDPEAGRMVVAHVLLDWVFGVGGDIAFRAFIYPRQGVIYNIDTDVMGRMEWTLANAQVCSERTSTGKFFRKYLLECGDLVDVLRENLKREEETWVNWLPKESRKEARRRAELNEKEIWKSLRKSKSAE